jgi:excinuclease ABC subunit A
VTETADWIIDLAPKHGPDLIRVRATVAASKPALGLDPRVAAGPPEEIVREKRSYTGALLKPVLARPAVGGKKKRVEAAE